MIGFKVDFSLTIGHSVDVCLVHPHILSCYECWESLLIFLYVFCNFWLSEIIVLLFIWLLLFPSVRDWIGIFMFRRVEDVDANVLVSVEYTVLLSLPPVFTWTRLTSCWPSLFRLVRNYLDFVILVGFCNHHGSRLSCIRCCGTHAVADLLDDLRSSIRHLVSPDVFGWDRPVVVFSAQFLNLPEAWWTNYAWTRCILVLSSVSRIVGCGIRQWSLVLLFVAGDCHVVVLFDWPVGVITLMFKLPVVCSRFLALALS